MFSQTCSRIIPADEENPIVLITDVESTCLSTA